ncbi:DUF1642 domain-containing protein [Lactococcus lactis]|uniref:DUF1642 domain-containing protein n=1 Tax=Lactococcus lactis TaxID=1358 RepID=UPI0005189934|nr:DUF1642 domain-containing protein [Lactococcus lactis]
MTKFELPEKPKKTNTSEDFNNLRKSVDELDKFDYTWKAYANKADRRINAANKYIEELERENQRLVAENLDLKTLVDSADQQQALPVVPECVADAIAWDEQIDNSIAETLKNVFTFGDRGLKEAGLWVKNNPEKYIIARNIGYTVEKPQLFYLKNKLTGMWLMRDEVDKVYPYDHTLDIRNIDKFTQSEIDSMQTGSYELVPVEDGE